MPNDPQIDLPVVKRQACKHLRSKGMYVSGQMLPDELEGEDHNCWCNLTQHALGPDDQIVEREDCGPDRKCYEGLR